MFEFDKYERHLHQTPPATPVYGYTPVSGVRQMSLLVWGEHCVECAAPACFSTCDLYQKRPDRRCRRFVFGAYRNRNFDSLRGYGAELHFKRWAKLEARGNVSLWPTGRALFAEKSLELLSRCSNLIGTVAGKITDDIRWSYVTEAALERLGRYLHRQSRGNSNPDAFLLELYNPTDEALRMQLSFTLSKEERVRRTAAREVSPSFTATVVLPRGYSRHEFEWRRLQAVAAPGVPFDISLVPEADGHGSLVILTADFVRYADTPAGSKKKRPDIKCIVWDVDNTLWDGILIEGDPVKPKPGVSELLKYFDERGILLSIASKNDHDSVWERLTAFGIAEYFLFPQINWAPKSQNIKTIAKNLNIGLDTFAFIDDNPSELDEVARVLPDLTCINVTEIAGLTANPRFQGSNSAEAAVRRHLYREAIQRDSAQASFGEDFVSFLRCCGIVLDISRYADDDLERAVELVQRTNQLNFSGHKYSKSELLDIIDNPELDKYILKCGDTYGFYGTVGFVIVERPSHGTLRIRDLMLSCRVQGKFLEQALLHHLVTDHSQAAVRVWVNFHETARNRPALNVLEALQFRRCEPGKDECQDGMVLDSIDRLACDFITVRCSPGPSAEGPLPGSVGFPASILR